MNMFWVPSDTIMTLPGESQTHKPFKNRNFQVSTHVQVELFRGYFYTNLVYMHENQFH